MRTPRLCETDINFETRYVAIAYYWRFVVLFHSEFHYSPHLTVALYLLALIYAVYLRQKGQDVVLQ